MSYSSIFRLLETLVGSPEWATATDNLTAYPVDWAGTIKTEKPFVKLAVLFPHKERLSYDGDFSGRGELVLQVHYKAALPLGGVLAIVDKLANFFEERGWPGQGLTTGRGYLTKVGANPSDSTLLRYDYHVPFTYFGGT